MDNYDLLEQDRIWVGARGIRYPLEKMGADYRKNVLNLLRRRADQLRTLYYFDLNSAVMSAPDEVHDSFIEETARELETDADTWLERRPLVQRLARMVREDDGEIVDGEVAPEQRPIERRVFALGTGSKEIEA